MSVSCRFYGKSGTRTFIFPDFTQIFLYLRMLLQVRRDTMRSTTGYIDYVQGANIADLREGAGFV